MIRLVDLLSSNSCLKSLHNLSNQRITRITKVLRAGSHARIVLPAIWETPSRKRSRGASPASLNNRRACTNSMLAWSKNQLVAGVSSSALIQVWPPNSNTQGMCTAQPLNKVRLLKIQLLQTVEGRTHRKFSNQPTWGLRALKSSLKAVSHRTTKGVVARMDNKVRTQTATPKKHNNNLV
jgi:hypothetical protein